MGHNTYREHHEWLVGDYALPFRRHFGFSPPRENRAGGRARKMTPGIPSLGTLGRYRNEWFVEDERVLAWMRYERELQFEINEVDPEGSKKEAEALLADGSVKETHHRVPIFETGKRGTRVLANAFRKNRETGERDVPAITCPEGGHIGGRSDHAGDGFNVGSVMDQGGNVISWRVVALNVAENATLYEQRNEIDAYLRRVGTELSILTTDSAFHTSPKSGLPRGGWHDIRVIENIHLSSHGSGDANIASATKRTKATIFISWNDKFWLDGHRQGHCEHGRAKVIRRVEDRKRGTGITVRTEFVCPCTDKSQNCGSVTLTAGLYRLANKDTVVRARPDEQHEVDWTIGNFMTFDDPEYAKKFGLLRRSLQEGFFGSQLSNRLGALAKRWIRRKAQAELDIAISLSILHAAKLAHRRERLGKPRQAHGGATFGVLHAKAA